MHDNKRTGYDKTVRNPRPRTLKRKNQTFHIIESIIIAEGRLRAIKEGTQPSLPLSSFTWSKDFIQSCKDNNLKDLDTSLYFSLKLPTSKQLFRFLDKRFYRYPELEFDLAEIAFERVGLSRSYSGNAGKVKEKLSDAIEELETRGFLKPLNRDERYFKTPEGWKIRLIDGRRATLALPPSLPGEMPPPAEPEPSRLAAELVNRGVTKTTAADLVQRHPADLIEAKLDMFDWLVEKQDKRVAKSPAGYLVKAINDDYATPKGFVSRAERQRQQEATQAKERKAAEERRRQHEQEAKRQRANAHIKQLGQAERIALEAEALAAASPEQREHYDSPIMAKFRDTLMLAMLRDYVAEKLDREQIPAEA